MRVRGVGAVRDDDRLQRPHRIDFGRIRSRREREIGADFDVVGVIDLIPNREVFVIEAVAKADFLQSFALPHLMRFGGARPRARRTRLGRRVRPRRPAPGLKSARKRRKKPPPRTLEKSQSPRASSFDPRQKRHETHRVGGFERVVVAVDGG